MSYRDRIAGVAVLLVLGTTVGMELVLPGSVNGQTIMTPSISLQERYDSNVVFGSGFSSGQSGSLGDYVTTVSPRVSVDHTGQSLKGMGFVRLTSEFYAKNQGLNYVGFSTGGVLVLDRLIGNVLRGSSLTVSDNFLFTPQLPSFLAPVTVPSADVPAGEQPLVIPEADIARGVQASRANTLSNVASVFFSTPYTSATSMLSSYSHQLVRFGNAIGRPGLGAGLLSSMTHSGTVGVAHRLSPTDSVTISGVYSRTQFTDVQDGDFDTYGANGTYSKVLIPGLTASLTGGYTRVAPPFESNQYVGGATLMWSSRTQEDTVAVRYSRAVATSIAVSPAPLVSNNVGISWNHRFTSKLNLLVSANYAFNKSAGTNSDQQSFSFVSYDGNVGLTYAFSRWYSFFSSFYYGKFEQELSVNSSSFDRYAATIGLTGMWPQKLGL